MNYAIYAACVGDTVEYRYTHDIRVDRSFYPPDCKLVQISLYMPLGYAEYLCREVCSDSKISLRRWFKNPVENIIRDKKEKIRKRIEKMGLRTCQLDQKGYFIDEKLQDEILRKVRGKALLLDEVKSLLGCEEKALLDNLQILFLGGKLEIMPSIRIQENGYICQRCGCKGAIRHRCEKCENECAYCDQCLIMGRALLCQPYILCPGEQKLGSHRDVQLIMPVKLTPAQQHASDEVKEFIRGTEKKALVWAACGAGKTEVTFEGIKEALEWGNRVLYAVPRRDVVIEISERFKRAFPGEKIAVLYGGSGKSTADFTVATTHQVLRYYREFDLVILDEVDAFPYDGNDMLEMAVKRSMKQDAKLLYMTATPPRHLYRDYKRKKIKGILIPARHHGHPLPVPTILRSNINEDINILPEDIYKFIEKCVKLNRRLIIFVPTVNLSKKVADAVKIIGIDADCIYSKDPERDEKRRKFYTGQLPVIVSTTVLERGITVEGVQVMVLFADDNSVFDERTLVQMAGRVGRTEGCPSGEVLFVARNITREMETAVEMINHMNEIARRKGYVV
ncbi:DEAD/DEAH box helicase family protein [Caldanaerobius polysaccharolyticus]|uniref:DEAD/DEAH box helicase family protein n=1 Tax=Caldanaerobius polysaccharolyticus TaxID=44256 RepID=UPI000691BECA|nr:DEAD/DEAH box helicase family protein [Caldanaerobius polysaccharolyticus]